MIVILSPAMNMVPAASPGLPLSEPLFLNEAGALVKALRPLAHWQLESLLKTGPEIAFRAFADYQAWGDESARSPALLAFRGLAYQHLSAGTLTPDELLYAQDHLRILSALYGLLRPLDGINPYRLDFMGRFRHEGKTLYQYWGDRVCRALFAEGEPVLNLCSGEYARLILPHLGPFDRLVTVRFLTPRRGKLVCVTTDAKSARGRMARFVIQERITRFEDLAVFSALGFRFSPERSSEGEMIFIAG